MKRVLALGFLLLLLAPAAAWAAGGGASDVAYVRLINGTGKGALGGVIGEVTFRNVEGLSPYRTLSAGEYELSVNKAKLKVSVKAGQYYSFAYTKEKKRGTLEVFEDPSVGASSRATVYVYNLSDTPVSLRAPGFNAMLIPDVAAGTSEAKEVDALEMDLALTVNNVDVKTFPAVPLRGGSGLSFVFFGKGLHYDALYAANTQKNPKK